jgi:hypothetical protein
MSQENVELVRRGNALFNAGDWDAAFALWHTTAEYRDLQHGPDMPEVVNGHDDLRRMAALWAEVYDEFGAEVYVDPGRGTIMSGDWDGLWDQRHSGTLYQRSDVTNHKRA